MPELVVRQVGPAPPRATTTVVLLHGFGAPTTDLIPLAREVEAPAEVRFLFPGGPLRLDPYGDAAAWWLIDMERLQRMIAGGAARSIDEIPDGLVEARALLDDLLDKLAAESPQRLILGGFSQGAMLALDVALHRAAPVAGLALMSGTHLNAKAWGERLERVKGVPVFMSHGRGDPLLPFAISRGLRDTLAAAGADVDWVEFGGGHEIPRPALAGLSRLIKRVAAGA